MIEAALNLQNEPNFSGLAAFEGQIRVGKPGPDMGVYQSITIESIKVSTYRYLS